MLLPSIGYLADQATIKAFQKLSNKQRPYKFIALLSKASEIGSQMFTLKNGNLKEI